MGLYERIKLLAKERKISIRKLEEDLGYGNGTIGRWEKNSPGFDKVEKVADYFGVTTDYLSGREGKESSSDKLSSTDLDEILDGVMSFDGEPMTDNDREAIRAYLQGRFSKK